MSEKYIVDRITEDVKAEAKAMVDNAKATAERTLEALKKELEASSADTLAKTKAALERERELGAMSEQSRENLSALEAKTQIVNDLFASVKKELLTGAANAKLVTALTKKYQKTGDTVTKSNGGIIISNKNYELKLTLDDLLKDLREAIEGEIVKRLFS